jgi:hypothetical protein
VTQNPLHLYLTHTTGCKHSRLRLTIIALRISNLIFLFVVVSEIHSDRYKSDHNVFLKIRSLKIWLKAPVLEETRSCLHVHTRSQEDVQGSETGANRLLSKSGDFNWLYILTFKWFHTFVTGHETYVLHYEIFQYMSFWSDLWEYCNRRPPTRDYVALKINLVQDRVYRSPQSRQVNFNETGYILTCWTSY